MDAGSRRWQGPIFILALLPRSDSWGGPILFVDGWQRLDSSTQAVASPVMNRVNYKENLAAVLLCDSSSRSDVCVGGVPEKATPDRALRGRETKDPQQEM